MRQKILVVEDNELNLKLFCDLLGAHGYEAEPVRDGREAVDRARSFRPDLIIMDIQMPHISGLELIEQMKADEELKATPIMAVTAYAAKGDEERIRDAGAEGYVSKPISLMRFIEAVRGLLSVPEVERAEKTVLRLERCFEAAPETLFDAWLDAETAGEWLFATAEGEMVRVEIEPWIGGTWTIVERRGEEDVLHTGTYEVIERPRRLAFTFAVPAYGDQEDRVTVEIAPGEAGSTLVLSHETAPAPSEELAKYEQGWGRILDGLAAQLAGAAAARDLDDGAPGGASVT